MSACGCPAAPRDETQGAIGPAIETVIEPAPSAWRDMLDRHIAESDRPRAARFREQLGLAKNRPVVMTGHQATFWHSGVLAKFIACDVFAEAADASAGWIVVDQDEFEFADIPYPAMSGDGGLTRATFRLKPDDVLVAPGTSVGSAPAFEPAAIAFSSAPALASVEQGLREIHRTFADHAKAPTAACQVTSALVELMQCAVHPAATVFATRVCRTDLFRALVERMRENPRRVVETYNQAVARHPHVGVAPLHAPDDSERIELPLWRIEPGAPRHRVYAGELGETDVTALAPRALFLTGILRLAASDLFIHGTGGAAYDVITEEWFRAWLDENLAPAVIVSATQRLPLPGSDVTEKQIADARWQAHAARHRPSLLDEDALALRKRELIESIQSAPRRSAERARLYRAMQEELRSYRTRHAADIEALHAEADRLARLQASSDIALDRTWAFPMHGKHKLTELRDSIAQCFASP